MALIGDINLNTNKQHGITFGESLMKIKIQGPNPIGHQHVK
jgi:hypothetical protein